MSGEKVHPVILSGGSGTRLWPLSRALHPKQLLALHSARSMLQETALRVRGAPFSDPVIVCNADHRFMVAGQAREAGVSPSAIVCEPEGRNTAPAAALAALVLAEKDPRAIMLVVPSDHVIKDGSAFLDAVARAAPAAREGALVTFGVAPRSPETGYGYILRGKPWTGIDGCYRVARFVEKPDRETAEGYLADGRYAWNSGIFMFGAARYLEELERLRPAIAEACRRAVREGTGDPDFFRPEGQAFAGCESLSIDYAVMEATESAAVVPVDMGWSDIGSWTALWEIGEKDGAGNMLAGDVLVRGVKNSYIRSEDRLAAAVGIEDLVLVVTRDAVLATTRTKAQDVKAIAEALSDGDRAESVAHPRVHRPWGHYQTVDAGVGFQVKHIMVEPGAKLSLQMHRHRAEHWVIVDGIARVTRGDEVMTLEANQSTYIPRETKHRLENIGEAPLRLIEVQCGRYLGEDDIVRFEDAYGRD